MTFKSVLAVKFATYFEQLFKTKIKSTLNWKCLLSPRPMLNFIIKCLAQIIVSALDTLRLLQSMIHG